MSIVNIKAVKVAFSSLLIITLIAPSVLVPLPVLAEAGDNDSRGYGGDDTGSGGGGEGDDGEGEGEADSDGDGTSDAAESEASEAAAASVSDAASIAGVEVSVSPVDTTNNPNAIGGASVSVNGVAMSVESAMSAIGAIADAQAAGINPASNPNAPGIDVDGTLAAHAQEPGVGVVGNLTGTYGTPSEVAHAEIDAAIGQGTARGTAALSDAAFDSRFGGAAVAPARDLSDALTAAYTQFGETARAAGILGVDGRTAGVPSRGVSDYSTTYSGPRGVPSQGLNSASLEAYSKTDTYSYDPNAATDRQVDPATGLTPDARGGWVDQNGRAATVDSLPTAIHNNIDLFSELARNNPDRTFSLDVSRSMITAVNPDNGSRISINAETGNIVDPVTGRDTVAGQQFGQTYSGPKGVPSLGLNPAALKAAVTYSNLNTKPVAYTLQELDYMARVMLAESLSIRNDQGGIHSAALQAVADVIAARVHSDQFPDTVRGVLDQQNQFQPVLDKVDFTQFTRSDIETAKAIAKSVLDATAVPVARNLDNTAQMYFANVPDTLNSPRASAATKASVAAMRDDRNSITFESSTRRGTQHTFGNRGRASDVSYATGVTTPTISLDNGQTGRTGSQQTGPSAPSPSGSAGGGQQASPGTPSPSGGTGGQQSDRSGTIGRTAGGLVGGAIGGGVGALIGGALGERIGGSIHFGGEWTGSSPLDRSGEGDGNECYLPYPLKCGEYPATAIVGLLSLDIWNVVQNYRKKSSDVLSTAEQNSATTSMTTDYVTVVLTVNATTGNTHVSRPDVIEVVENPERYPTDAVTRLRELMEETPILLNGRDEVVYSNGLYSPLIKNGVPVVDTEAPKYVYLIEYTDAEGNILEVPDNDSPDGFASSLLRKILGNDSPFYQRDVAKVVYFLINHENSVPGDEMYHYAITLTDGSVRAITVPEFSSVSMIKQRFAEIGYQGDVLTLVQQADKVTPPSTNPLKTLAAKIGELFGQFTGSDDRAEETPNLSDIINDASSAEIRSVFIYPITDINCPSDTPGYDDGFMYTALINNRNNPGYVISLTDGRCGYGDMDDLLIETANHLATEHGLQNATVENILNKTSFLVEPTLYTPGIFRVYAPTENEEPTTNEVVETPTDEGSTTSTTLPNLTNDITFEVKAVGSQGQILLDWTITPSLTIGSGVQLYFRWNGTAYQQCLPFLNDSGNYALTVKNQAMVSGNTEAERYDVREASTTYRVECGGQRNNEFGVDSREVEVTIQ